MVSSNGWISFDTALTNPYPVPQKLPAATVPNKTIAWFWRDLDQTTSNGSSYYGPFPGGFMVRIVTQIPGGSPDTVIIAIMLYKTGAIKVSYQGLEVPETGSIGIENALGTDGLNPSYIGVGENGFTLTAGKAVVYYDLVARGTIDAYILQTLQRKQSVSAMVRLNPRAALGQLLNDTTTQLGGHA